MSGPRENGSSHNPFAAEEDHWAQLADKTWSKGTKYKKVTNDFINKQLWQPLEGDAFNHRTLGQLENLGLFEYLWRGYSESSTNHHVLLAAFLATIKNRQNLPVWDLFAGDSERFTSFFRRVLSLSLDKSLSLIVRTYTLSFLITAFQSLDNGLVRRECAPLASISIWHNLSTDVARERKLEELPQLKKAWRASTKRYEAVDDDEKAKLRFERSWLYTLLLDFIAHLRGTHRGMYYFSLFCHKKRSLTRPQMVPYTVKDSLSYL